jgi:hypothetical protein
MKRSGSPRLQAYGLATLLVVCSLGGAAVAQAAPEVLRVDLSPLIDQAARSPTRFAVDLPHPVSITDAGTWTQAGSRSTWTYAIRIPTAVSMSFHAPGVSLPQSAVLTVTNESGASIGYRARDVARSGLWSRPMTGDSLTLSLSVSSADRARVALQIESFQAGYRGLGPGVPNNAHYADITRRAAAQLSSCAVNYSCESTSANQGPAHATVALVVANTELCTGTLLNDTSVDGTPFVLTARHCETGNLGGGDPGVAANVTVYWDAVAPCGATLASIYDGNTVTQTGATTVVEQQDTWLIRLDTGPAASDAYYAGWDATGGVFSGGYSIHHALGYQKQYAAWYGQPILIVIPGTTLGVGYSSTFWGVVNQLGNVGAGASGGSLFDPDNNSVGALTLGLGSGPDTDGVCPVTPLQPPSPAYVAAQYTALSAVWSSTADATSGTGTATLQSALDAAGTGKLVLGGIGVLPVTLTIDQSSPQTGQTANLTWSAPGAQSCTASGGLSGDGWAGARSASGTFGLTEQTGSQVRYSISCSAPGQTGSASVSVTWQLVPAFANLSGSGPTAAAGRMVSLQWSANIQPCTASGGTSGDGWAGTKTTNGSQSVVASVLGSVTYTIVCGTGTRTATAQYTINVVAPSTGPVFGDANQMLAGQTVNLQFTAGGSCVASGGASGDGWSGPLATSSQDSAALGYTLPITETMAGTYTYTVTCTGAGATANLSSTSSITLTFVGGSPSATLSASPTPVEIYTDPGAAASVLNLAWTSNVRPCAITYAGPGNVQGMVDGVDAAAGLPSGTGGDDQQVAGSYVYTLTCGAAPGQAQATAPVTWFTNAPGVTLSVGNPWPEGTPATLGWQSNVYPCTGTGGTTGDGWAGAKAGAIGSQSVTEPALGAITFGITCGSGSQIVQAQASTSVIAPLVSITASASTLPVNGVLDLHWSGNFEPCTSSISPGGAGGWGTVLPMTGGFQTTQLVAGTYTYTINCAGAQASVQVTFTGSLTTLTASASTAAVNTPITLSWSSPANTTSCAATGGSPGDGWTGSLAGSGTQTVTSAEAAAVSYSISCNFGYGPSQAQTQVTYTAVTASDPTVPTPKATLTANLTSQVAGSSVTLSWTSQSASACAASGGASGDGWTGSLLSLSGTMSVTESTAGSYSYGVTCTGAPPAATAQVDVAFTAASVTVTGKGGGGGGGAVDPSELAVLAMMLYALNRRTTRSSGFRLAQPVILQGREPHQ